MPSSACKKNALDRKSTRLNSSHTIISYAVFCLKKKFSARRRGCCARSRRVAGPSRGCGNAAEKSCDVVTLSNQPFLVFFFLMIRGPPRSPLFPYPPLFRSTSELQSHDNLVCRLLLTRLSCGWSSE